jgi:hypothetical protein
MLRSVSHSYWRILSPSECTIVNTTASLGHSASPLTALICLYLTLHFPSSRTSSLDSNSMLDPRKDRQTGLLQHRPSAVAGTCPVVVVLVGSTWAVVAGRTVPVVGRSPVLVAGMGWESRSSCCQALVGCSSLGGPFGPAAMGHHHRPAVAAGDGGMRVARPVVMSVNVHLRLRRCRESGCGAA